MEVHRYHHQSSRKFQLTVVFHGAVAPDPADGEGLWVAARPGAFCLTQFPLAPFQKQHNLSLGFAIRKQSTQNIKRQILQ